MSAQQFGKLIHTTSQQWFKDNVSQMAAALAFYTAISTAPLVVIVLAIAGFFYGERAAEGELILQMKQIMGSEGAKFIEIVVENANQPTLGGIASLLSIGVLIWGATNVFAQLQFSLNTIWHVEPRPGRGLMGLVRDRLLSFGLVLGIGFLLLVSLIFSAILSAVITSFTYLLPESAWAWPLANFLISFVVITLLFALILKILPDVHSAWRDIWIGALVTALLFSLGQFALGFYLGTQGSAYGVAGSLVVYLLWVFYSAQILFIGAEFTQVYASRYGQGYRPNSHAVMKEQVTIREVSG
jgi:membrane protein